MSFGKIEPLDEWASDGGTQIVAPTAIKVARGWNAGEEPLSTTENWKNNRDEQKINELAAHNDLHSERDFGALIVDNCSSFAPTNRFNDPVDAINIITPFDLSCICRGYDYTTGKECVFGLSGFASASNSIRTIQNAEDGTIDVNGITTNIPTGLKPVDLCCDGSFIYALYNSADDADLKLYKIAIGAEYTNGVSTVYTSGLVVSGGALTRKYVGHNGKCGKVVCVADANNIAYLDDGEGEIAIVAKNFGSAPTTGTGNVGALDPTYNFLEIAQEGGICSDGSRIWFIAKCTYSGQTIHVLCATLISNPTNTAAGLTRDWDTDPPSWWALYLDDPTFVSITETGLVFDGQCVNVSLIGYHDVSALKDWGCWIFQFDVVSEYSRQNRFRVASGFKPPEDSSSRLANGGIEWTGKRLSVVFPHTPVDPETTGLFADCNQYQNGHVLINPFVGGADVPFSWWGTSTDPNQMITVDEDKVVVLEPTEAVTTAARVSGVVFADDCLWVLRFEFAVGDADVDDVKLTRITSLSSRA
jgi:hypothetical protein